MSELHRDLLTRFGPVAGGGLGLGIFGTDMFLGGKVSIPEGVGPYIHIRPTGGAGVHWVKTESAPSRHQPTCQIIIIALSYSVCETKARAVHSACFARNILIGGTRYETLDAVGEPMEFPLDDKERVRFQFNVRAKKAP